jgi:hypothetical protein
MSQLTDEEVKKGAEKSIDDFVVVSFIVMAIAFLTLVAIYLGAAIIK